MSTDNQGSANVSKNYVEQTTNSLEKCDYDLFI